MARAYHFDDYRFELRHLSKEDGGGFLITWPDLPGCMSDGDSIDQAIANGRDAFASWMHAAKEAGNPIPVPSVPEPVPEVSGKILARLPKSLHGRLALAAASEAVSINQLLTAFVAEGLARRA